MVKKNKPMTQTEIVNQIRTNSNVAYEANELAERLERFWYNAPKYFSKELLQQIESLRIGMQEIVEIEYHANEKLLNKFKKLSK